MFPDDRPESVETFIIAWKWGKYLGEEALANGVNVCVSSWRRAAPDTFPAMAKAGGNYLNSQLALHRSAAEWLRRGDSPGCFRVAFGRERREYLHRARRRALHDSAGGVDPQWHHAGLDHSDRARPRTRGAGAEPPREMLYVADEVFFCGTAAEVTPIRSVDRIPVGEGRPGPVTQGHSAAVHGHRARTHSGPLQLAHAGSRGRCPKQMNPERLRYA